MTYRYTEAELADIKKRQAANLAEFQRNSGRGLPPATVKQMERAQGVKLDSDGAPVPKPLKGKTARKSAPGNTLLTAEQSKHLGLQPAEAAAIQELERGGQPVSGRRKGIATSFLEQRAARRNNNLELARSVKSVSAPAIARHRKRAECDGILFDSQLEMRRYRELKLLKAADDILYFLRQVPFHLPGGIVARVDFMVVYRQRTGPPDLCFNMFEDCKAPQGKRSNGQYNDHDRVGVNKRKQIRALYGVTVKLVTKASR